LIWYLYHKKAHHVHDLEDPNEMNKNTIKCREKKHQIFILFFHVGKWSKEKHTIVI
jgi:hypothetical protein